MQIFKRKQTQGGAGVSELAASPVPKKLEKRIISWKYGAYGWTSPVNLMITACWVKWLFPSQDVCKIWAKDAGNNPIKGSYSIRSCDERITVPLVSRLGIYHNFCSNNSGMQGTRAIEKTRVATRLSRDTKLDQRVLFDLNLFVNIMNDINELDSDTAKSAFQYFLEIGLAIAEKRNQKLLKVRGYRPKATGDTTAVLHSALTDIKDPQFIKIVGAVCLKRLAQHSFLLREARILGIEGTKTGADARTRQPGDLWLEIKGKPVLGCEVKDSSKQFGFEILSAVEDRYTNNGTLRWYILLSASDRAVHERILFDPAWSERIAQIGRIGLRLLIYTFREFLALLSLLAPIDGKYIVEINECLSSSPDLKKDTIELWQDRISKL